MRGMASITTLLATGVVGAAHAGFVTVTGPSGQVGQFTQLSEAMDWIRDSGDANVDYSVFAPSGTYDGEVDVASNAALSWGNSPGVLEIDGSFRVRPSGRLTVEIGGTSNANALTTGDVDYDTIFCTGPVLFEGTLKIDLVSGFTPVFGDRFEIIVTGGGVTLAPTAVVNGPILGAGLFWELSVGTGSFAAPGGDYNSTSLFVTVVPGPSVLAGLAGFLCMARSRRRA